GRPKNAENRRRRVADSLAAARRARGEHLVLTGDLTEDGLDEQFTILAELLNESGWAPERVTLVPGNHDAYTDGEAWDRALAGPLRAYRATSTPGVPIYLSGSVILPISTAFAQPYTRSAGTIRRTEIDAAARLAEETRNT